MIYPFSLVFERVFELGPLYLLYITCLGIYKTNTINIYAGINGLEVGQSIVAACGMLLYFGMQGWVNGSSDRYNYSVCLLLCLLGVALALLKLNQYPSQVFVGDTFCYFAGIVLAVAAIEGIHRLIQDKFQSLAIGSSFLSWLIFCTPCLSWQDTWLALAID